MQHFLESALRSVAAADAVLNVVLLYILFLIRQNHRANGFLALFVICCASPLVFFVSPIENRTVMVFFVCLVASLMTVSGSFMYLYVSILSGDISSIGRKEFSHLLLFPAVLTVMLLLSFPLDPFTGAPRNPRVLSSMGLVLLVCVIMYSVMTFFRIRKYSKRIENWFSDLEKVSMNWVKAVTFPAVALFLIWMVFSILVHFKMVKWGPAFILPQLLIIGLIPLVTIFYVVRQPEIFKAAREMRKYDDEEAAAFPTKGKYAKQNIDEAKQKEYHDALLSCMALEKPFLDEELTISRLSRVTAIPVHQLSIVINSMLGKNFSAFVNEFRIAEAIDHMRAEQDANILSVAFRSGFNSKSAFNKTFKKVIGCTPSEYRKTMANGS